MFSELVQAARTLDRLGIVCPQWHPRLAPMPGDTMFVVSVDQSGLPVEVEMLKTDTGLHKIREDAAAKNTASFPGFNLLIDASKLNSSPLRAFEYAARLQVEFADAVPELINFTRLLDVIGNSTLSATDFHSALVALLPASSLARKVKFKDDKNKKYSLYLDLIPALRDPIQPRVAHSKTSALINQHLLARVSVPQLGIDHYSGEHVAITNAFPSLSAPILGQLKLYSLNTDAISALSRYELTNAFTVSMALVQSVSATLNYLTADSRKGKTWCPVPSQKTKESDLLIAYFNGGDRELLDTFPSADMFGVTDSSDADFAALCEPAIQLLKAKLPANPELSTRLLVLHKVSRGVQQVALCRDIHVRDLIEACTQWQAGALLAPEIRLPVMDKKTSKPRWLTSRAPYPLALSSTINRVWKTDPDEVFSCDYQYAFSASDAYDVFLWHSPLARQKTERALTLLVERIGRVLSAIGRYQVQTYKRENRHGYYVVGEDARKYALNAMPLIGILLFRIGHSNYMNTSITQLGHLLQLMDGLHLQYCRHVRKGDMPTQLIGNSFFNAALTRPLDAFVNANTRLQPYRAWAQTVRVTGPECELRLVKYLLGQINVCSGLIDPTQFPAKMTTLDKAKFICGYHLGNSFQSTQCSPDTLQPIKDTIKNDNDPK
ncbi:MAG: hypothetical protein DME55_07720 [Verrucomicrobia bacterium]|nr:MAG: hypothetical protein DME55_07720 [Verrucomicrobiota bacterium]